MDMRNALLHLVFWLISVNIHLQKCNIYGEKKKKIPNQEGEKGFWIHLNKEHTESSLTVHCWACL